MKVYHRFNRTVAWLLWVALMAAGIIMFCSFEGEYWWHRLLSLEFPIVGTLLSAICLYAYPRVCLQQDGVKVKWWLCTHFYPWNDICQAGIFYHTQRGRCINCLVLVRTSCSKRGYHDYLFHIRNFGKLIYIPVKPKIITYVRSCYGPLDFDFTDDKAEESIVVDVPLDTSNDW